MQADAVTDAVLKLIERPECCTPRDIATVVQVLCATRPPDMALQLDDDEGAAALAPALLARGSKRDFGTAFAEVYMVDKMQKWAEEDEPGVGRGYSKWPRAPYRVFNRRDRVAQFRVCTDKFKKKFSLSPTEFDVLFTRCQPALDALTRRWLSLENRLAMALHYMRTKKSQEEVGEWFGCGHTSANDDIDDVVRVIFNDADTANEISWPTQEEGDAIVIEVARYAPNLAGAMVAGDAKKRAANQPGRTFDKDRHKLDYDGKKGHGRQLFLACEITTGRMCYLDANYGGRGEAYNYAEYDICRQHDQVYWRRTFLPADASAGRSEPCFVKWTGVGDAAYSLPVHNGAAAERWYHPKNNDPANARLNANAEYTRAVVEHQFGRIGSMWKMASDNSGPWHHVGNGGHKHDTVEGQFASDHGMAKSVMYYTVCARLTAMTQRMRHTYPRDPAKFFQGDYEDWEMKIAMDRIHASKRRR